MEEKEELIIDVLKEESDRIRYGKILIEVTVADYKITNVSYETKRSININYGK